MAEGQEEVNGTGGEGAQMTNGMDIGMDAIRGAAMHGLDESYHDEWNTLSERITTPSDFAKSYIESQRYAKSAIRVPNGEAKPEDWDKFYDRIGRPAKADDYQFTDVFGEGEDVYKVTDEDKSFREAFKPVAHRLGLTQKQVSGLEAWQFENNQVVADAGLAKASDITDRSIKVLKEQYGPDFEKNKQNMLISAKHYAGDDWEQLTRLQLADGTFLMDNPVMFRMLSKVGAERVEDFREPNEFNQAARADAQTEYNKIRNDAIAKGISPSSPEWPTAELQKLSDRIHGTANAMGGRTVGNF